MPDFRPDPTKRTLRVLTEREQALLDEVDAYSARIVSEGLDLDALRREQWPK